jgi:hypothetical protein
LNQMNQQYSQNDYLQAGGLILDANSMRKNPQPTQDIFKKSVSIGFNYFSSFKEQRGKFQERFYPSHRHRCFKGNR